MKLPKFYIAFWIQAGLVDAIDARSDNAIMRKDTLKVYFGWAIRYNQKLCLNYMPAFDNREAGFTNINFSLKANPQIGVMAEPTYKKFGPIVMAAAALWRPKLSLLATWIDGVTDTYRSGVSIPVSQLKGGNAQTTNLEGIDVGKPVSKPIVYQNMKGEMELYDRCFSSDEEDDDGLELHGAAGYEQDRLLHAGKVGNFFRKFGKGIGKAATAIGRVAAPEFAPVYDIADKGLNRLGNNREELERKFHRPSAEDRVRVFDTEGNETYNAIATTLP